MISFNTKYNITSFPIYLFFFLFGFLIIDTSHESVIAGYVLNNQKNLFNDSSYVMEYTKFDLSFLYVIPFYFSKLGINIQITSMIFSGFLTLISMLSTYHLSFFFNKNKNISFFISFILTLCSFTDTRTLFIEYPNSFWFGQIGLYMSLLCIGLFLNNQTKNLKYLIIILFFIHVIWCIFAILFITLFNLIRKKNIIPKNILKNSFSSILTIFFILLISYPFFLETNLLKNIDFQQNFLSKSYQETFNNLNRFEEIQSPIFFNEEGLIYRTIFRFAIYDILLIGLYFYLKKKINKNKKRFFYTVFIFSFFVYLYFITHGFLEYYFDNFLINNISRAAPHRVLILNNVIFPIITLSIFLSDKKSIIINNSKIFFYFCLILTSTFFLNKTISIPYLYEDPYIFIPSILDIGIILILLLMMTHKFMITNSIQYLKISHNIKFEKFYSENNIRALVILLIIINLFLQNIKVKKENNEMLNHINLQKNDSVVLSAGIHGYNDILQLWNLKTYYITNPFLFNVSEKKSYTDIFCLKRNINFKDQGQFFQWTNNECLSKRDYNEWKIMKDKYNIKYLITKIHDNELDLKMINYNSRFRLYEIH